MSDKINDLIDTAIQQLADDDINSGVGCLTELAELFAKAGLGIESFWNTRKYIINEAIAKTDAYFIMEKIKLAERDSQHERQRYFTDQAREKTRTEESTGLH